MGCLITPEYVEQNRLLHAAGHYGLNGHKRVQDVIALALDIDARSILDYGCGQGTLKKNCTMPVYEYDPAIRGKDQLPNPADLVVCGDVLEHVEPECLKEVLAHLKELTKKVCYVVVHIGPARKSLPDGRNAHLIQESPEWWRDTVSEFFHVEQAKANMREDGRGEFSMVLVPLRG